MAMTEVCQVPPPGWFCSRTPGHSGPCAARQAEPESAKGFATQQEAWIAGARTADESWIKFLSDKAVLTREEAETVLWYLPQTSAIPIVASALQALESKA